MSAAVVSLRGAARRRELRAASAELAVPETQWLRCRDGEWLATTLWRCASTREDAPTVIINSAMGNTQARYFDLARWWVGQGWRAVTYDYRGIGATARRQKRLERFRLWEWGSQDLAAIIDCVRRDLCASTLLVVGHSIGAQIVQFCGAAAAIDAAVFIGGQKGYWRNWPGAFRYAIGALWHVVLPANVAVAGNFQLMRLVGCEALPARIALDWARWGRSTAFAADVANRGGELRCPVLSISLDDDWAYAPKQAVDALIGWYPNARSERLHLVPKSHGVERIGHAGLFDEEHFERFWPMICAWIDARRAGHATQHSAARVSV